MPSLIDIPRMIVALVLAVVVIVGILAGYNPFEFLSSPDENDNSGIWVEGSSAPKNQQEIQGNARPLPASQDVE